MNEVIISEIIANSRVFAVEPITTALAIGGIVSNLAGAIFGSSSANKRARREARRKDKLTRELNALENTRQSVINPYEGITDLSSMITDLSSMANNPYNSLAVATAATDMQIEQTDLALANTLDTLRSTGASAGGATALARMALESKKGVSADIQQQEARNQKLRLDGEANLQQIKMTEARRVQGALYSEAGRQQQADVSGSEFVFTQKERRETEQLNRKQAQITGAAQAQVAAQQDSARLLSSGMESVGNIASSLAGSGMFSKTTPTTTPKVDN